MSPGGVNPTDRPSFRASLEKQQAPGRKKSNRDSVSRKKRAGAEAPARFFIAGRIRGMPAPFKPVSKPGASKGTGFSPYFQSRLWSSALAAERMQPLEKSPL